MRTTSKRLKLSFRAALNVFTPASPFVLRNSKMASMAAGLTVFSSILANVYSMSTKYVCRSVSPNRGPQGAFVTHPWGSTQGSALASN